MQFFRFFVDKELHLRFLPFVGSICCIFTTHTPFLLQKWGPPFSCESRKSTHLNKAYSETPHGVGLLWFRLGVVCNLVVGKIFFMH